ncbi:MAG: hypothetical protein HW403_405, partial [Dehalococcoidia bacterium]|nr:hypothetical protein [Dehalococcoidia bacterium]
MLGWSKELHRKAVQLGFSLRYEGSPLGWRFRDLQASQWLARDEIRDLQWRKLRALVHHAYSHVPYYRRIMDDLGIGPEAIRTPQDYARLPILTKAEVNAHREEMVAENFPKSRLIKTASGGSTGAPVALYHDPEMVASYRALKLRNFQWVGWRPGDAWVRLWGSAFDVAPHQALRQRLWDKVGRVMVLPCFEMSDKTMERYARALASFEPDIIEAYVTPMHLFARFLQARGGPTIRPRGIICSAEMLFSHQRELIQEVFGCKVFNRYGGREMGDVAHECEAGSMHINAESIYVEFIRDGRPAEPGVPGEIILTALDLYGMPLLRYQVEDIGAPRAGGCPCGRGLPTMEMVEGRIQDIISLKSG